MEMDYASLLEKVSGIAKVAGNEIMKIYQQNDFDVTAKNDNSPLTRADTVAHHKIVNLLGDIQPSYPILSEEDSQKFDRSNLETLWLVDPLDGTKEFINRNGEFTVNIALIHQGKPILGVVYAPAIGVLYRGSVETGAEKIEGNKISSIKANFDNSPPVLVMSRSHRDSNVEKLLEQIGEHTAISMGSSLKLCLIAEGTAMLYPRLAPTMEWDTAAADAIVRAAGGKVLDIEGKSLTYNKGDLHNPYFIAQTADSVDWQTYNIF